MTITLQRLPRTAEYEIRPVEVSNVQRSTNGVSLPINRGGDHFEIEIDVRSLGAACARELTVDLLRGRGQRLRVPLPLQNINIGPIGTVVVNGSSQSGSSLNVRGGTPYAVIRKGWHLTIVTADEGRLAQVGEEVVFDGEGEATIPFWPMMRVPPEDGDTVEIAEPFIEGFRSEGGEMSAVNPSRANGIGSFVIEEAD